MDPPREWLEQRAAKGEDTDVKWKLLKEWYGRRVAGTSWVEWFAGKMKQGGFVRCSIAPWFYYHPKGIHAEIHMDDVYGCGPPEKVKEIMTSVVSEVIMKWEMHEKGTTFSHLKKVRTLSPDGRMFIQPDPKHIDTVVKLLGLGESKPAPTPGVSGGSSVAEGSPLEEAEAKIYRSCTGILMYVAPERPDAQYCIRELTKAMKEPTTKDKQSLVRVVRYLSGTRSFGVEIRSGKDSTVLQVYSDTDWAACKRTRKSTACGTFILGGNLLYSYSRGLGMICLSSGESEFNGGVAAASEALFFKQILEFHGHSVGVNIWLDSSAARGVFQRQGVGRIRHLEAKSLWVQEALRRKNFALHAVGTHENTADIGTKALGEAKLAQHREALQVWSYERFRQTPIKEVGSVSSERVLSDEMLEAISKGLRMLVVLGSLDLPVTRAEKLSPEESALDWFQVMMIASLVWTSASAVAFLLWAAQKIHKTWWLQARDRVREAFRETRDTSGSVQPREGGSPIDATPASPESSIDSVESWREYVRDAIDPKLTCSEWEKWMSGMGYVLVRRDHQISKKVIICQYGRVVQNAGSCETRGIGSFSPFVGSARVLGPVAVIAEPAQQAPRRGVR